jgi:phosphoribosylformylglycinamidine cyclo-ligase
MGIGMVIALPEEDAAKAISILEECGERASVIGRVIEGEGVTII